MRPRASFPRVPSSPASSGWPELRVSRGTPAAADRPTSFSPARARAAGTALLLFLSICPLMFTSNSRRDKEAKMVTENKAIQVVPPEASARVAAAQAIIAKGRALRHEVPDFTSAASHGDGRLL